MSSETGSTGGEDRTIDMRSESEGGDLFWTWIFPWAAVTISVGLLLLSFWLDTAGPVDEVLFSLTTVAAAIFAVGKTLNELNVISL